MWRKIRRALRIAGPGIITGAADDDPSGIATYSQTGARFGYSQLWAMLLMVPMMIALQEMCARIGIVKGMGIAGVARANYHKSVLYTAVGLMLIANMINLGADIGAMAAAARLIVPLPFFVLAIVFAVLSLGLQITFSYRVYSRYLKWLTISLFAYVLTGFVVSQDWSEVLHATLVPHIELTFGYLMILVGVLGTTISPYLFFWQASEEVEEEEERGGLPPVERLPRAGPLPSVSPTDIRNMRIDTWSGMIFSQIAAWFIIITAAGSLHKAGMTNIATAADAAKALEPLVHSFPSAGKIAEIIFAVGIVGLGLLAIPTLAGAASYGLAETFGWKVGLFRKPADAPQFYVILAVAMLGGMAIDFAGIDPIKALIFSAIINGVVAVPLILLVILIANNRQIMGKEYANGFWSNLIGWLTLAAMALASIAMLVSLIR